MVSLRDFISLIRYPQWYKNLAFFIAVVFSMNALDQAVYPVLALGFASLCLVSSAGYVINDIIDAEKDKVHPSKKNRPIPSGKIGKPLAAVFAAVLMGSGLACAYYVNMLFVAAVLALFALTFLYSVFLKNYIFVDVIVLSVNFVVRAVSGGLALNVVISPWLVLCSFLLSLFLALVKRRGDLTLLGEKAADHKKVLGIYTEQILDYSIVCTASMLLLTYGIYLFLGHNYDYLLMTTIPVAFFLVFRYMYLLYSGSEIARSPEKVFFDKQMLLGILLWGLIVFISLYGTKLTMIPS